MGAGEQILARIDVIEKKIDRLIDALRAATVANSGASSGGVLPIADDADLDGQYGDPDVKFSPKRWSGYDHKGSRMSDCPPDFLDSYAEALQYSSEHPKAGKEKYASYDARDAARARGWARRIRARGPDKDKPTPYDFESPAPVDTPSSFDDDKLPF